jgi:hypothetical protein
MRDREDHPFSPTWAGENFYVAAMIAIVLGIVGWVLLLIGFLYHLPMFLLVVLCLLDAAVFVVGGGLFLLQYTCPPHKLDFIGLAWVGLGVIANIALIVAAIVRWLTAA